MAEGGDDDSLSAVVKGFAGFVVVTLVACGGQSRASVDDPGRSNSGGASVSGGGTSGSSDSGGSGATGGASTIGGSGPDCTAASVTCSNGFVYSDCSDGVFQCSAGCRPLIATAEGASDPGILCDEYQAGLGEYCFDDFDCLSASSDAIARCSSAGICELAPPKPNLGGGCGPFRLFPEIELNEARVLRGPLCESGACVLRHSSIDPESTRCTSRCVTDRDCELMYSDMTSCRSVPMLDAPDTHIAVCMPPLPW